MSTTLPRLSDDDIRRVHDQKACLPDMVGLKNQWPEIIRFAREVIAAHEALNSETAFSDEQIDKRWARAMSLLPNNAERDAYMLGFDEGFALAKRDSLGHQVDAPVERSAENGTDECICKGNWRLIVKESAHLLERKFRDHEGNVWSFFGFVHAEDDYYYGMWREGRMLLRSCVGALIEPGWQLVAPDSSGSVTGASSQMNKNQGSGG